MVDCSTEQILFFFYKEGLKKKKNRQVITLDFNLGLQGLHVCISVLKESFEKMCFMLCPALHGQ